MAKSRNKRQSGNSCASAVTKLVFVALCIFAVWKFTPNSLLSTGRTTTRTAVSDSVTTGSKKFTISKDSHVLKDNPSDLVIKRNQEDSLQEDPKPLQDDKKYASDESNDEVERRDLEGEKVAAAEDSDNIANQEDSNAAGDEKDNMKQPEEENEKQEAEISGGLIRGVSEDDEQKLNEHDIRLPEESSMTHHQQTEKIVANNEKVKSLEKTFETMEGHDQIKDDQESNSKHDETLPTESKVQEDNKDDHESNLKQDETLPTTSNVQVDNKNDEQSDLKQDETLHTESKVQVDNKDDEESNSKQEETLSTESKVHEDNKNDARSNLKQDETLSTESKVQEDNQRKSQVKRNEDVNNDIKMKRENQMELQSGSSHKNSNDTNNEVTDEENEQRMEQQQQQEENLVNQNQQPEEEKREKGEYSEHDENIDDEVVDDSTASSDQNDDHETEGDENSEVKKEESQHEQSLQIKGKESKSESKPKQERKRKSSNSGDSSFPTGESSSGIPKESKESKKAWSTQADQSENQKQRRRSSTPEDQDSSIYGYSWQLCNVTAGPDYIPCLDNEKAISKLHSRGHYEHRERHCPEDAPTCLVPLPQGYKTPVEWPHSRDKIWYHNVPHTLLAEVKGHQNWVKKTGEFLTFPGGGTQFIHGALHYIDFIQGAVPEIAWGKHTRTVLDVGCGVASFGGFLFERDVIAMSFAPKDEHEAQVQFALERGIPAISAVMGSQRLPFPSRVFDLIHCARCRVPWHLEGGALLLELNRMLRPGGYFVWSATPVYQKLEEDVQIWKEMSALTISMCWELVTIKKDKLNSIGAAIYHKPDSNECYEERNNTDPPMCKSDDDPNAAWYVPLHSCMHRVPVDEAERGSKWPQEWPKRLQIVPYWLNRSQIGIYGKPAPDDFLADYEHWQRVVSKLYLSGLGISWSNVRNIMDMRAVYGGFAAALKDLKVWVMNVVNIDSPDTLPIIYERGLFGIYHDWCESFSTYPRTYDLLHADHLFSMLKKRCKLAPVLAEVDRIVRPGGKLIVRDESTAIGEIENMLKSLHWEVHLTFSKNQEGILSAQKSDWRPDSYAAPS